MTIGSALQVEYPTDPESVEFLKAEILSLQEKVDDLQEELETALEENDDLQREIDDERDYSDEVGRSFGTKVNDLTAIRRITAGILPHSKFVFGRADANKADEYYQAIEDINQIVEGLINDINR